MKTIRLVSLLLLGVMFYSNVSSQERYSRKERKAHYSSNYNYEVQISGVGQDGTKVMKVWGYGKRVEDAIIEAKK